MYNHEKTMTSTIIIDRIENDLAVVESETESFSIPIILLPNGAKEGDSFTITFAAVRSESTKKEAQDRLERLKKRDSGNDIIDL